MSTSDGPTDAPAPKVDHVTGKRRGRTPRANASERRWEDIVVAATEMFAERGYEGTSLKEIAESVGLLKGSMYYYIESKEDLLYEVTRRALERRAVSVIESSELAAAPAPRRLYEFIRRWMMTADIGGNSGLVAEREFRKLDSRRLRSIMRMRHDYEDFVRGVVTQGIDEGTFHADLNVSVVINTIFPLTRSTHAWFSASGPLTFEQVAGWTAEFVVRGLGGDAAVDVARTEVAAGGGTAP